MAEGSRPRKPPLLRRRERGREQQNEPDAERLRGGFTESAAAQLRAILEGSGIGPALGFGAQQNAVEQWARQNGKWLGWDEATAGTREGGIEHLLKPDLKTGRVFKVTIPPAFGRTPTLSARGEPRLVEATPLEYLAVGSCIMSSFTARHASSELPRGSRGSRHSRSPGATSRAIRRRTTSSSPISPRGIIFACRASGFFTIPTRALRSLTRVPQISNGRWRRRCPWM